MFEMRVWHWLFAASFLFMGLTVYMIYRITFTGDLTLEWMLLLFMSLAMASFILGWYLERKHKKSEPDVRIEDLI